MPERRDSVPEGLRGVATLDPAPTEPLAPEPAPRRRRRVPALSPLPAVLGWMAAWGAASVAAACLSEAGVELGLGLGVATGEPGVEDRFFPGLWVLVIQAGAFALGGYAAGRIARSRALLHAGLAWALAMLATGADALTIAVRDGGDSVLQALGLPHWAHTGLSGAWEEALALAAIALTGLAGAALGGSLAATANRTAPEGTGAAAPPGG